MALHHRVNYPGLVTTADLFTVKSFLHSVVFYHRNFNTDTRFASLDIVDFFLGTPLERPEFVLISTKFIPEDIIDHYNLSQFISNGGILFRVDKCMYGLPQAAYLSNKRLVEHLATQGCLQDSNVPCLFAHLSNKVSFALIVDDFKIKYSSIDSFNHLVFSITSGGWKCKTALDGSKYVGLRLSWDYNANMLTTSMPHYVATRLARFAPGIALKSSPSPAAYVALNYGAKVQYETDNTSPPATPDEKI